MDLEIDRPRCPTTIDECGCGFEKVTNLDRNEKLNFLIGPEEALVAVESNAELGGDVAEDPHKCRPGYQEPSVMGIAKPHPCPQGCGLGHGRRTIGERTHVHIVL